MAVAKPRIDVSFMALFLMLPTTLDWAYSIRFVALFAARWPRHHQ
jgi:hypothetical protein